MSLLRFVIAGAVFLLLMLGVLASHYGKVKRVDGTLVATALALAIGIYFIVAVGVQTGQISQLKANIGQSVATVAPQGITGSLEMAYPVRTAEGTWEAGYKEFPWQGVISVLVGVLAVGLGVGASRRGEHSAGQTLMVLGIFLIVIAVVVFAVLT